MFLQATVDAPDIDEATKLLVKYRDVSSVDYVEIGAPMITHYGVSIVDKFKEYIPVKNLYADLKMIDFPHLEAQPYIDAGIRRISAMAVMNNDAFIQLRKMVDEIGIEVFVSMMGYPKVCIPMRVHQLQILGFDKLIAHGAGVNTERAFKDMCEQIELLDELDDVKIIAAGGIDTSNISKLRRWDLEGIIVGRGLASASDSNKVASLLLGKE